MLRQPPGFQKKTGKRCVVDAEHAALNQEQIESLGIRVLDKLGIILRSILEQRELSNAVEQGCRVSEVHGGIVAALPRDECGRDAMPPPIPHKGSGAMRQAAP